MNKRHLIESLCFPFEFICPLAERESWRKEIHRPVYHLHKWWAKRLGSVFRATILGCLLDEDADLEEEFYNERDTSSISVLDPFMGSGTTVGEAHKLGCIALGRDINPIAAESVRVALGPMDIELLDLAYEQLSNTVGRRVRSLYQVNGAEGDAHEVLYFFWVKQVSCPSCTKAVDLFSSYVFAQNAYPHKKPEVQIYCARCDNIFSGQYSEPTATCPSCAALFDVHDGPVKRDKARCSCGANFRITDAIRLTSSPPEHRLYAKLVLGSDGQKRYLRTSEADEAAYRAACHECDHQLSLGLIRLPVGELAPGFNTDQALSYNYREWRQFFNQRQLLALGWMHEAIASLEDRHSRDVFLTLFSGVLEFNNMFASYKGEGTGAVRHMFAHHVLKPERAPIEANVWGTPKSSGSFSNLYKSRLQRVCRYRSAPYELTLNATRTVASPPFSGIVEQWPSEGIFRSRAIYLSCGSSDDTGLPDASVDFVVTDPPFFDNVHYSELADFFYAWQRLHPRGFLNGAPTTRNDKEVQDTSAERFSGKLQSVFAECHRVLKTEGLLVFSYHHSRASGWRAVAEAVYRSGFHFTAAHPVKSEMSVAMPKTQAAEPIQLDVLLVCRKSLSPGQSSLNECLGATMTALRSKTERLRAAGLRLSKSDVRIVAYSSFLSTLGETAPLAALRLLEEASRELEAAVTNLALEIASKTESDLKPRVSAGSSVSTP